MKRKIIRIDEEKCNGCAECIPECKEGALQIIDGKCRLVSDLFCDGLGACIGTCPEGAITIEEREAEPYNEIKVIKSLLEKPHSVLKAHLEHLKSHGADEFYNTAVDYLKELGIDNPITKNDTPKPPIMAGHSCPGSLMQMFDEKTLEDDQEATENVSRLQQWPIHLHLVNPNAPYFKNETLIIMSVCGPLASANIHEEYIRGNSIVVACPKLDYTEPYADKLAQIFSIANTPKVIIVRMEVPCCGGLLKITDKAVELSGRKDIQIEEHILSIRGDLKGVNYLTKELV